MHLSVIDYPLPKAVAVLVFDLQSANFASPSRNGIFFLLRQSCNTFRSFSLFSPFLPCYSSGKEESLTLIFFEMPDYFLTKVSFHFLDEERREFET
jgi:hypothetical protein